MSTAIILAGGKGTRLKPMTDTVPKPLLRTPRKTILECQVEALYSHGVHTVYILIHQSQYQLYKACVDELDLQHFIHITLVTESDWLGTAGAVVNCLWTYPELSNLNQIIIINGDIVCNYPFSSMISTYKRTNCACLLTHFATKCPSEYGLLKLTKVNKSFNLSSVESSEISSISSSSCNSDITESLSAEDMLASFSSFSSSTELTGIFPEEIADRSTENSNTTLSGSLIDTRQIMRIKNYEEIHRSGKSIARVSAPHAPSSPAGLRCNKYEDNGCNSYNTTKSKISSKTKVGTETTPLGSLQLTSSYGQISLLDYSNRCWYSLSKQLTPRTTKQSSRDHIIHLGKVSEFIEKPQYTIYNQQKDGKNKGTGELFYANAGVYIINPALLLTFQIPCSMETVVFPALIARKLKVISLYIGEERTWSDMGTIAGFIKGCQILNNIPKANTERFHFPIQSNNQSSRCKLKGSCAGSVVDDTARISNKANVVNCVVYENIVIPSGVYLDGCIVCSAEKLSPGKSYYNTIIC